MNDNLHPIFKNILYVQFHMQDVVPHSNSQKEVDEEPKTQPKKCRLRFCDSDIIDGEWAKSCSECQHYR
jgi:hypothetical protein